MGYIIHLENGICEPVHPLFNNTQQKQIKSYKSIQLHQAERHRLSILSSIVFNDLLSGDILHHLGWEKGLEGLILHIYGQMKKRQTSKVILIDNNTNEVYLFSSKGALADHLGKPRETIVNHFRGTNKAIYNNYIMYKVNHIVNKSYPSRLDLKGNKPPFVQ